MAEQKNHKEQLNVEEALTQSESFLINNKKTIIGGIVLVVLIIAGYFMFRNMYALPREEKAQAALFKGEQLFEQNNFEIALNGDSASYMGFIKVADEFSGTDAANLANAYAGLCYAHLNNYAEAVKYLDKFDGDDVMVAPAILAAAGNCYAELENYGKAVDYLLEAADRSDSNSLSPIFLMQAGKILVKQGKASEAVKVYTRIKEDYPQSFQTMEIDKYINQAEMQSK